MNTEARYPIVVLQCSNEESEDAAGALWDEGALGIEERDAGSMLKAERPDAVTLVAHFEDDDAARACVDSLKGMWALRADAVIGDAWRDAWKAFFKPIKVGERLWVCPSWEEVPTEAKAGIVLQIDPGAAFGTGTHETTQLVLRTLESLVKRDIEALDVGCGSGILAIAAAKLGARHVVAIDNDPQAIIVSDENAEINRVSDRIQASTTDVAEINQTFALVLANIEYKVLSVIAPALTRVTEAAGTLVLSGLLAHQQADILACFPAFKLIERQQAADWIALVLCKTSA